MSMFFLMIGQYNNVVIIPTSWDTAYISSKLSLSNLDLTVTHDATVGHGLVRTVRSRNSGKVYIEIIVNDPDGAQIAGLVQSTASTESRANVDSIGFGCTISASTLTYTRNNGSTNLGGNAATINAGDIIMFAVDFDNGMAYVGHNGIWKKGNPDGSVAGITFTAGTALFFCCSLYSSSSSFILKSGNTFSYTAPSGYGIW